MAPRPPYSPAMKLATFRDGSRGGQLAVVSGDLARACYASGIAATLQQALHDWNFIAPQLQALANELNSGHARHTFAFDPTQCLPPLPATWQWAMAASAPAEGTVPEAAPPEIALAAGDTLRGPRAAMPAWPGALDFEPQLAAIVADVPRAATPEQAQDAIRLLVLTCPLLLRDAPAADRHPATAVAAVAITPDELGAAWQDGAAHLTLQASVNGRKTGLLDARRAWPLKHVIAASARTRALSVGSLLGSGPAPATAGHASLQARRASDLPANWLQAGDTARAQARTPDGAMPFGTIELQLT